MVLETILGLGLALIALTFGLRGLIAGQIGDTEQNVALVLILVLLVPIQAIDALQTGLFAVFSKPRAIFFRKYILSPGFKLAVALLVVLGGKSVVWLAAGTVIAGLAGVALYTYLLWGEMKKRGLLERFHFSTMRMPAREIFTFTIPLLSSDLLYTVMNTTDAILLGHFGGATDVGAFRVIGPLAQMNSIVLASFSLLFTPMAARLFARQDHAGINKVYWGTAVWTAILTFPIFALTFSLAEPMTTTLFGERYASVRHIPGAALVRLLLPGVARIQRPHAEGLRPAALHLHDQHPGDDRERRLEHRADPDLRSARCGNRDDRHADRAQHPQAVGPPASRCRHLRVAVHPHLREHRGRRHRPATHPGLRRSSVRRRLRPRRRARRSRFCWSTVTCSRSPRPSRSSFASSSSGSSSGNKDSPVLETTRATRFLPGSNVKGEVVGANWRFLLPALRHDRIVSFGRPGRATLAGLEAACEELVVIEEGTPANAPDRSADVVLVQGKGVTQHEIQRVLAPGGSVWSESPLAGPALTLWLSPPGGEIGSMAPLDDRTTVRYLLEHRKLDPALRRLTPSRMRQWAREHPAVAVSVAAAASLQGRPPQASPPSISYR